ncbi:hypothetical protein ATKI12_8950 [Kitasatospora sp. Ki12]
MGVAACALATVCVGTAQADPSPGRTASVAQPSKHVPPAGAKVAKMTVRGVDRQVAESHGFKVVTGPDGTQHVVPTAAATNPDGSPYKATTAKATTTFSPDNVVEGNCGDSYLWVHAVGGYVSEIETGFDLNMGAVAYHWQVNRSDTWGSDSHSWGGGLGVDTSWHGEWDVRSGGATWETAGVVPSSDALLWDGEICSSGGPSDTEWIF